MLEKDAVFPFLDVVEGAAFFVGDNRAASGKGFDWGDAERFHAWEKIAPGLL